MRFNMELNVTEKLIIKDILNREIDFDNLAELEQAEQELKQRTDDSDAQMMLERISQLLELTA